LSFKNFDLLPQSLRALKRQKITNPTPIQEKTIPHLLESKDVIGQAATGSGKTLAFALPLVEFVDPDNRAPQALVITPTRELANQIVEVISDLVSEDGLKVLAVYGGRSINPQINSLKKGVHILVATPGRLIDLLQRRAISLKDINYLVLDEADEMLDRGFARDVEKILGTIKGEHVTALFSATMPDWVHEASKKYLYKPVIVTVEQTQEEEPQIEHTALTFAGHPRIEVLRTLLDNAREGSSIVFGRTKRGVRRLAKRLDQMGYDVSCLQGNMSQNARDREMKAFRDGQSSILVATNVAARGLDVDHVELVVNYELPESSELLTHRVGRTGRMGREGLAYTLIGEEDSKKWNKLKRDMSSNIRTQRWKRQK
jgi:ATP-dependent RNA helicase DeaD